MRKAITRIMALVLILAVAIGYTPVGSSLAKKKKKAVVKSVKITNASQVKSLLEGDKVTLKVKVTVKNKASKKVTYKSSNKKVATVSAKGVIAARKAGTTKITVTSKANKKKKATVTVKVETKADVIEASDDNIPEAVNPVASISFPASTLSFSLTTDDINDVDDPYEVILNDEDSTDDNDVLYTVSATLIEGASFDISKLSWASDKKDVVKVDKNGTLTLVGFGKATITAYYGSVTASFVVNVIQDSEIDDGSDDDDGDDSDIDDGDDTDDTDDGDDDDTSDENSWDDDEE